MFRVGNAPRVHVVLLKVAGLHFLTFVFLFSPLTVCLCMVWILHNDFMFFLKINGDIFAVVLLVCVVFEII